MPDLLDTLAQALGAELRKDRRWHSVPLTGARGVGRMAVVDAEDYTRVAAHSWNYHGEGYATSHINGKQVLMHRFILNAPDGVGVDHIDRDRLNNRRSNLRQATKSQNAHNSGGHRDARSRYKGVSLYRRGPRWRATIYIDRRHVHLGVFDDESAAARAYDQAARQYHGEFARTNFEESDGHLV